MTKELEAVRARLRACKAKCEADREAEAKLDQQARQNRKEYLDLATQAQKLFEEWLKGEIK